MKVVGYTDETELQNVIDRSKPDFDLAIKAVKPILDDVKENGDPALFKYTKKFDRVEINKDNLRVTKEEIQDARLRNKKLISALQKAYKNIEKFHLEQFKHIKGDWEIETEDGVIVGEKVSSIESIGAYVPGGRAVYPSTVLMTCIPAKIAKVKRIVIASPPPISDPVLVAADICGVDEIYRVGGVQAIAALAYGTKSIKPVDKIVGPGNMYVTAAKLSVYGCVDIDMPAGPSEILILADDSAKPRFIVADVLAQLEHDPASTAVLVTQSMEVVDGVSGDLKNRENFTIILGNDLSQGIEFVNRYAPEHLEIMTRDPKDVLKRIKNAGAIFLGDYSAVAAGDYASGGNHILPTMKTAKFSSALSVRDFLKVSEVQKISKEGLKKLKETIEILAQAEGMKEHKKSITVRFEK